jgi:N-acetylneuraminic acid mutarotase
MESLTSQAAQLDNKANPSNTKTSQSCWTLIDASENVPSQRSLHVGVILDDSLFVFGGYDGTHRTNDFYKFDFFTCRWSIITSLNNPPSARDRHTAIVYDKSIYVFGGFDGVNRVNDFYSYSLSKNSWSEVIHRGN